MRKEHLALLACPESLKPLVFGADCTQRDGRIENGSLLEVESGRQYPIVNFIPRFVPESNYAASFGYQWNLHLRTQQDGYASVDLSEKRFLQETKWKRNLSGSLMLEVGSGAGRFTTHAASTQATLVSFDYSNAVEANYQVNGNLDNVLIIQADVFNMPFPKDCFDYIFCFGMLQHTPNPARAFQCVASRLKGGGQIASDVYRKSWKDVLHVKPYVRPFVKRLPPERLYALTRSYVDCIWPVARLARKSEWTQKLVSRFVADRSQQLGSVPDDLIKEWAYLDTFDWFSPAYDKGQTLSQFKSWHERARLQDIDVCPGFNGVEGRAVKPADSTS